MKELLEKGTVTTAKGVFTLLKTPPFIQFVKAPAPKAKKSELIAFLKMKGLSYEDKTPAGGAFWIAGGKGIQPIIQEIETLFGITAQFAAAAKALKKQPGWYYTAAQFE